MWVGDLEQLWKDKRKAKRKWRHAKESKEKEFRKEEWKKLRVEMKRRVRAKVVKGKFDEMKRIESLGRGEPAEMWRKWKSWRTGGSKKKVEKLVDILGNEVKEDEVAEKWREVFRKVVVEVRGDYDDIWKERIEDEVKADKVEEEKQEEDLMYKKKDGEVLNAQLRIGEVEKAIEMIKNGKASGVDEVVGEILKYGGKEC